MARQRKRIQEGLPLFNAQKNTAPGRGSRTAKNVPRTLFPLEPTRIIPRHVSVSRKLNQYQTRLERLLDRARHLDELKAILRIKKPGRMASSKERREYRKAQARAKAALASLSRLGVSREKAFSLMKKRTPFLNKFYSALEAEVKGYAKRHKIPPSKVKEISNEVSAWSFVNPNNQGEIAFHTLIELRRLRLKKTASNQHPSRP